MRIKVAFRDKVGKDFITQEIKRIGLISEKDTQRLAKECEKIIQQTIMNKAEKPTGYLASKFLAERIPNGWGVGDIATLDKEAPYWNHIDKGSEAIGANWQHWLPKGYWQDGRWVESGDGYYAMPKTPIKPLNYIADTLAIMEVVTPEILRKK